MIFLVNRNPICYIDNSTLHLRFNGQSACFMLYKIVEKQVYVIGIYHDLQDYENNLN